MGADRLLGRRVVDVGTRDAETALVGGPAADALAAGLDGAEVFGVGGVAQVLDAGGRYGVAEALDMRQ